MMNEFTTGGYVLAKSGHDKGKYYVIFHTDNEYVYLVDGRIRTMDRPKRKKRMHVIMLAQIDQTLADKVNNKSIKNEEIKRAIKLLQYANSSMEGKSS